jgi:DNA (cytosine-5)-methyltransferase 1
MTHLGLFEGIGGFSLAARWMGWETLAWCEWNEFGQKVLKHHFPEAEGFGDITKTDFTKYANRIDILTGGFPCQPYSAAGKRLGKEDERHLWPEMLRVIREVQPSWVVGENVLGLVNWSGGLVFHEVQADLEAAGYEVFPFVLPACSVNAPHRRDRVWFVGHRKQFNGDSTSNGNSQIGEISSKRTGSKKSSNSIGVCNGVIADTDRIGHEHSFGKQSPKDSEWREGGGNTVERTSKAASDTDDKRLERECRPIGELERGFGFASANTRNMQRPSWDNFPTQSPLCSRNDGLSIGLVGITVSKHRQESLKAYGNAIVPQVAFQIFKAIQESIGK